MTSPYHDRWFEALSDISDAQEEMFNELYRLRIDLPSPRIIDEIEAVEDYRIWRENLVGQTKAMAEYLYVMASRTSDLVASPASTKTEFVGYITDHICEELYQSDERAEEIENAEARREWEDMRKQGAA